MPEPVTVDIARWVDQARDEPRRHLERQATEIVLAAIAMAKPLREHIFLKGGVLMGLAYKSPRTTADLDFSATFETTPTIDTEVVAALDAALPRAAVIHGFPDVVCRVQSVERKPRRDRFDTARFPGLIVRIGYARRGGNEERRLLQSNASHVIELDISFNEPVGAPQPVRLGATDSIVLAYSLTDLIAEKYRALLQQPIRKRYRRQDVYDIALLLPSIPPADAAKADILAAFRTKCAARGIAPTPDSLDEPEVVSRARSEWDTLHLELGELPPFEACFDAIRAFYRGLPWDRVSPPATP